MAFKKSHFQGLIELILKADLPTLYSDEAVSLLLGTAAQESLFGTYLVQLGVPQASAGLVSSRWKS